MAAPIRVGVRGDGTVYYSNVEYWSRAYLGGNYGKAEGAVKGAAARLAGAFGAGKPAGGDVKVEDLPGYRYMVGMERFGDRSELNEFATFEQAVNGTAVEDDYAKCVLFDYSYRPSSRSLSVTRCSPSGSEARRPMVCGSPGRPCRCACSRIEPKDARSPAVRAQRVPRVLAASRPR